MTGPGLDPVPAAVPAERLARLRTRLTATHRVPLTGTSSWDRGVDADYLTDLVADWARYDWRPTEQRLSALPWVVTGGARPLRSIHQVHGPEAPTVVLLHGWPDSFLRFAKVLPLLGDVNVVVPCLPGYPYGFAPTAPGMSTTVMAALHLTDIPYTHLFTVDPAVLSEAEHHYREAGQQWQLAEGAYALEQSTKPHTLAVGLGDSPAGLGAWIVEKLRGWSNCGGDVESVWTRAELLDWITLYWATDAIGSSFTPYVEQPEPITGRVEVPTFVSIFPHDLVSAPRAFGERFFAVRAWHEHPDGGHFAAWERPDAFVSDLREALAYAFG